MPKISVIIPTYNREVLIVRAIRSVLNQTFSDFEIIVVDDGSTDNTKEVVQKIAEVDSRIIYIYEDNFGGPSRPRNLGIKNSRANFLTFLDSDDEMLPNKLEEQIKIFEKTKDINLGFVGCNAILDNGQNKKILPVGYRGDIFKNLLLGNFIHSCSNVLVKKEIIDNGNLFFDEKLSYLADWDMWLQISRAGYSFEYVDKPLFVYYEHSDSMSNLYNLVRKTKEREYVYNKYFANYKNNNISSNGLRHIGIEYCLAGEMKRGRKYFQKSLKVNLFDKKAIILLLISFLRKKNFNYILNFLFGNNNV